MIERDSPSSEWDTFSCGNSVLYQIQDFPLEASNV
jgi:hypothetical protein